MSYTFSRRAFFKYSAAMAVAVAGASLLGGCQVQDPNNPTSTKLGQKITNMQVTANLETFDMTSGGFKFSLLSARENPVRFSETDLAVTVLDEDKKAVAYYDDNALSFTVEKGFANKPYLKKGDEAVFNFTIDGFQGVQPGQTVRVQYIPVSDYSSYSMVWEITNPKPEEPASSDTSNTTTE